MLVGNQEKHSEHKCIIKNRFNDEIIGEVSLASENDIQQAINKAVSAQKKWSKKPLFEKVKTLLKIGDMLSSHKEELAKMITYETGKPISLSMSEVDRTVSVFTMTASTLLTIKDDLISLDVGLNGLNRYALIRRFPIGTILSITPYNFPLILLAHKVAPALAMGNSIISKPAPQCPIVNIMFGKLLYEAGIEDGSLSVLPCENKIAELLVNDDNFSMLSFTGSTVVGWYLKSICGKKRVSMEFGGNAAVVIEPECNSPKIASRVAFGAFAHAGQICISIQRIYIHKRIYSSFKEELLKAAAKVVVGNPNNTETLVGPMIDDKAIIKCNEWVSEAVENGGKVLCGGKQDGKFYLPTLIEDVPKKCKLFSEEVFAPIALLYSYDNFEEVLNEVNDSKYGLQAGIYTSNIHKANSAYEELNVGGVLINDVPTFRIDTYPYGGVKDSGLGREGTLYTIDEMSEKKTMIVNNNQLD